MEKNIIYGTIHTTFYYNDICLDDELYCIGCGDEGGRSIRGTRGERDGLTRRTWV